MNKLLAALALIMGTITLQGQKFEVDTLSMTGPTDQRINMVFLSDGYREAELPKFIIDAHWMMDALFAKAPYAQYRNYFNCFAINVPSEVSGAADDPTQLINNYFGSTFNYNGIWRLVVPTRTDRISRVLMENFPVSDQVFMIVNDSRYGGSGGWIATSTTNSAGPEICIHELGHSFGGLSDEYWVGPGYARENINMTAESDTALVRWNRWLGYQATGIYPHAESPTWYRPHQNCEMRYLNSSFCPVCKEAIVSRILAMTNPILGFTPVDDMPDIVSDTLFKVSLLAPEPNTLKTWWELNRNEIATGTDSIRLSTNMLVPDKNILTCFILDTTSYIRNPTHPTIHLNKVTWNLTYISSGISLDVVNSQTTVSVYPNPASEIIQLTYQSGQPLQGELKVYLVDLSGKPVSRNFSIRLSDAGNEYQIPLPRHQLAAGLYYLIVQAADHQYRLPVVIGT
ncbi:MAG: M64 family metallopeptidase [Bacteroidales bacterium]|jgi:hypothetical protein